LSKYKWPVAKGDNKGIWWKTTPLADHTTRQQFFKKKSMTIFTTGFSFRKPGANVDLGPVGEWAEPNVGVKKHRQNSKTSLLVFIRFLFAFGFA